MYSLDYATTPAPYTAETYSPGQVHHLQMGTYTLPVPDASPMKFESLVGVPYTPDISYQDQQQFAIPDPSYVPVSLEDTRRM